MLLQSLPSTVQAARDSLAARETLLPGLTPEIEVKVVVSVVLIGFLVIFRRLLLQVVEKRVHQGGVLYRWSKVSGYVAFVLSLVIISQIWFTAIRSLGTFLGLLTAGLAIALKDLVADLAGWVFILTRKPFELGDRIEIGGNAGDVVDIRIFAFTIMEIGHWTTSEQSTGRMIHLPNAKVFTEPLANYTDSFPYLWNELPVLVTFESDWRKAKSILEEIIVEKAAAVARDAEQTIKSSSKRFLIYYRNLTPIVYTSVLDSGVLLTIRYLCLPRGRRGSAELVWEAILDAFDVHDDIDFAYPTQRLYLNPMEGKPGARAPMPPFSPGPGAP